MLTPWLAFVGERCRGDPSARTDYPPRRGPRRAEPATVAGKGATGGSVLLAQAEAADERLVALRAVAGQVAQQAATFADHDAQPAPGRVVFLVLLEVLGQLLDLLGQQRDLDLDGILLTMFDARNNLSHQVVEEVRSHFPGQVCDTVIPRNVRLSEAPSHGKPVLLYDVASRGSQSYMALAEELIAGMSQRVAS